MDMTLTKIKELCKSGKYLFSGSIALKDSEEMLYIVNELKDENEERKIEIQTYASDAKNLQQQNFKIGQFEGL